MKITHFHNLILIFDFLEELAGIQSLVPREDFTWDCTENPYYTISTVDGKEVRPDLSCQEYSKHPSLAGFFSFSTVLSPYTPKLIQGISATDGSQPITILVFRKEKAMKTMTNPSPFLPNVGCVQLQVMSFIGSRTSTFWEWVTIAHLLKTIRKIAKWQSPFKVCTQTGRTAKGSVGVSIQDLFLFTMAQTPLGMGEHCLRRNQ